jgi:hypothetical protein
LEKRRSREDELAFELQELAQSVAEAESVEAAAEAESVAAAAEADIFGDDAPAEQAPSGDGDGDAGAELEVTTN